ncbi:hypothetical protein V1514DRAFT_322487 [Lipomyces japonicus]|uniref:uncharacterized protein n=1 Tax=Lipomyces japonicus TaxID=56871 RepID=UPI0034CD9113
MYYTSTNKKPFSFKKRKTVDDSNHDDDHIGIPDQDKENQPAAAKGQQSLLPEYEKKIDESLVCVGTDISDVNARATISLSALGNVLRSAIENAYFTEIPVVLLRK